MFASCEQLTELKDELQPLVQMVKDGRIPPGKVYLALSLDVNQPRICFGFCLLYYFFNPDSPEVIWTLESGLYCMTN